MKRSRLLTAFMLVAVLAGCSHAKKDAATPPAPTDSAGVSTSPAPGGTGTPGGGTGHTGAPTTPPVTLGPDGQAPECPGGSIVFGTIDKPYVLTRVSLPFTVVAGKTTRTPAMSSVGSVSADVKAGPQVPTMDVYRAFTAKVGVNPDVVLFGEQFDGVASTPDVSSLPAGKYVAYNGIHAVQSTFIYTCDGQQYEGFVSSYLGTDSATVKCGAHVAAGTKPDGVAAFKRCKS